MDENKNLIFRKQSLDRISSPEELDSYLVVTRPGIWLVLTAIVVLLAGLLIWAIFGRLDTTIRVAVVADSGQTVCMIPEEQLASVKETLCVTVAGQDYALQDAGFSRQTVTDENVLMAGDLSAGAVVVPLRAEPSLPDGIYVGEIVIKTVKPISFILN